MKRQWTSTFKFALVIVILVLAAFPALPANAAPKTASVSGPWNNTVTWGGSPVPTSGDDITINSGVTVTVGSGLSAACNSINFTTGISGPASITLAAGTSSLTVGGAVTIQQQAGGGSSNQIDVGAGTLTAASVALSATTDASRPSQILISSGTVTVSGNISSSGTASRITFSGAGRLNAGGTFMSGSSGTFTPSSGTVNFNAAGVQTVGAYAFNDLMLSGSGDKSLPAGASLAGTLSITGTAKASVAAGQNLSVDTLNLGGQGTANGTWGSTSSPATFQTNTYFAATTGYLTVTSDTRSTQVPLVITGPASVTYGSTGTITKTGGSGTGAVTYSRGASTGCTVNATTGVIIVNNVTGSCTVTATKAADKNFLETTSDGFAVTLTPRAVTLTGTRPYDTTSVALAGILSITNKVGADDVSVATGSATLASATVGTRSITSMGSLALGGVDKANYTLAGATGSVIITKADQATLIVSGPASVTYGTTGTITTSGGNGTGVMSYNTVSSSGCTVNTSSGVITMTDISGTCTVTATRAADTNYNATTSVGFDVTLTPRPATLTGTRPYDTTAVALAGILSVTNKVGTDVVTIASGSATLESATVGARSITSMGSLVLGGAAAANYTLIGATGSVIITKADQAALTVSGPASVTYGTTGTITYEGGSGTGAMSYGQDSSTGCTVNASTGVITVTNASLACTVTATKAADSNYIATTSTGFGVTLNKAAQATLTVSGPASVTYGTTGTITTLGGSSMGALSYNTVSSTGCTVNPSSGVITMTDILGSCVVTATMAANNNYLEITSAGFTVALAPRAVALTGTRPYDTTAEAAAAILSITNKVGTDDVSAASGSATLASANVGTRSITSSGSLVLGGVDKANYTVSGATGSVTITKADQVITFPAPASPAAYHSTFAVTPSSSSGLAVSVLASGVCSINGNNVTMTSGAGTCTLTAKQAGDSNYNPAADVVRTVAAQKADQATLTVSGPASLTYGTLGMITYTGGSSSGAVSYSHVSPTGCIVNAFTGSITVTNASLTCTVTVIIAGDDNYNVASASRTVILNKAIQVLLTVSGPASLTYGTPAAITYSGGSGTGALSYSHGLSNGCTVDPTTGMITVTNTSGSCTVTVTRAADDNYLAATSAGFPVILNKAPGSVSINNIPGSAAYGGSFTPTFTKLGDGQTFVASRSLLTCTATPTGVVNFIGMGTCTLQDLITDGTNHLAATGELQSFSIGKANQTIRFTSTAPISRVVGGPTYTPTATADSGLLVDITLDDSSIGCSLSGLGVVSFTEIGICVINANQAGSIYYNAAPQVHQSIVVVLGYKIYLPLMFR